MVFTEMIYGILLQRNDCTAMLLSAGGDVRDQTHIWARFAVILYNQGQFVFSARRYDNTASSYICQLQQQGLLIIPHHSAKCGLGYMQVRSALSENCPVWPITKTRKPS